MPFATTGMDLEGTMLREILQLHFLESFKLSLTPAMIAVGSNNSSPNAMAKVQIFEYNENARKYAKAKTLMTVTDPVHDIAFAPNLGRSFHILAIATKDVRIFTLKPVR